MRGVGGVGFKELAGSCIALRLMYRVLQSPQELMLVEAMCGTIDIILKDCLGMPEMLSCYFTQLLEVIV